MKPYCRSRNFQRTANSVLTICLSPGGKPILKRQHLLPNVSEAEIDRFLNYAFHVSNLVHSVQLLRANLRDPDDELILELAVESRATIMTHNKADFAGAHRLGIEVKTPAEFLKMLRGQR